MHSFGRHKLHYYNKKVICGDNTNVRLQWKHYDRSFGRVTGVPFCELAQASTAGPDFMKHYM